MLSRRVHMDPEMRHVDLIAQAIAPMHQEIGTGDERLKRVGWAGITGIDDFLAARSDRMGHLAAVQPQAGNFDQMPRRSAARVGFGRT